MSVVRLEGNLLDHEREIHLVTYIDIFFQPKRIYYLEDHTGHANEWVKKIEEVHRAYFGDSTHL